MMRVLGSNHPKILQVIYVIATFYFKIDRIPEGIELEEELRGLEGGEGRLSKSLLTTILDRRLAI